MPKLFKYHYFSCIILLVISLKTIAQQTTTSLDTIVTGAVVFEGDTISARSLEPVTKFCQYSAAQLIAKAKWTRLRNAIYVTYPYAKRAGAVINDVNAHLEHLVEKEDQKLYIKTREKELKKEFSDPLTNLSIYQGKVLMKLINRETGNNCYELIKDYKGGFTARFYQTVAFFFGGDLKQPYDKNGDDKDMETIVKEVERMYGN